MTPLRLMFDTSAVRSLESNGELTRALKDLIDRKLITIVICRTVSEELWAGNRRKKGPGIPVLPVDYVGNTVGAVGLMACGDSIGEGLIFDALMDGALSSKREKDALVGDATLWHADVLVTDDLKFVRRFRRAAPSRTTVRLRELPGVLKARGLLT